MDWLKAKKAVIFLLVVLNVLLGFLNYRSNDKYMLPESQKAAVKEALKKNGIEFEGDIGLSFAPMRELSVNVPEISVEELRMTFLGGSEDIKVNAGTERITVQSGSKTLAVDGNAVFYTDPSGSGKINVFDEASARKEAENFIKARLPKEYGSFVLSSCAAAGDAFVFKYYNVYKKNLVFCSNVSVTVEEAGVTAFSGKFFEAEEFTEDKKDICSADEALLTFMKEIKKSGYKQMKVSGIDIGYDIQTTDEIAEGRQMKLIPYYYIYSTAGTFAVKAYTNEIKN